MELLPQECITSILSRNTAKDACRFSLVSKTCHADADSDDVWGHFLPSDHRSLVSQFRSQSASIANARSMKALYLALSDQPIIFDEGKKSFQLHRKSGKKCYMLAARALSIDRGDDENHWQWTTFAQSRSVLSCVCFVLFLVFWDCIVIVVKLFAQRTLLSTSNNQTKSNVI